MVDERFRDLVQHRDDAIVLSDAANTITYASPAIRSFFGFEPAELVGHDGFSFIHPAERPEAIERAQQLVASPGSSSRIEFRLRRADGTYHWCECTSVNLLDDPDLACVVNTFHDIDERKAEAEQHQRNEFRLHALLEHADGAIALADAEGVLTWASPGAGRLWGFADDTMVGRRMIDSVHPDDQPELIRRYRKMTSARGLSVRIDGRMQHVDGSWRWYETVFSNCLDDPAVSGVVANVRDISDRVRGDQALRDTEARLEHQAHHDSLTGLPNRALLADRLETALGRARRTGAMLAVLLVDVDHFQIHNDGRGHAYGDAVLRSIATRLGSELRSGDTLARLSGDQFVIVADDLDGLPAANAYADALLFCFDDPLEVQLDDASDTSATGLPKKIESVFVSVSVGVARTGGRDTQRPGDDGRDTDAPTLLRDAEAAVHQAKADGRRQVSFFDAQMHDRASERLHVETALRHAILRHQFQVHYQPIIDLPTGRITGIEALVRWDHPQRGMLFPGSFIPVAEETGLIIPLGAWIFDTSCCQLVQLEDILGPGTLPSFQVSINLSARQLAEDSLTDDIANVLAATPIDPRQVCVEVTESAVMRNLDATSERLAQLKVLGLKVAIDDFGTGHSSFSYLQHLPADTLKIDRSFVVPIGAEPHATDLVAGIISLAHTLGLDVVAEGVETDLQFNTLRQLGCDRAQGHLFATAMPSRSLIELLRARVAW